MFKRIKNWENGSEWDLEVFEVQSWRFLRRSDWILMSSKRVLP